MVLHFHHSNFPSQSQYCCIPLAKMLTTDGFHASFNEGEHVQLFRWGTGTMLFILTSSSVIPNDSVIISPDKDVLFTSISDTTTFLATHVPSPSPDTFSLASSTDGFDACGSKGGDEE